MTGADLYALAARLFPIPRSITGDGVRQSLAILAERIALEIHEIPTGTPVFDWTVPREWRLREAHITAPDGRRIADAAGHNLQLLNYSAPFRGRVGLEELKRHLFTLPEQPDLIPYRTSYYKEQWGFCLPHRLVEALPEGEYEVVVDTELFDGSLVDRRARARRRVGRRGSLLDPLLSPVARQRQPLRHGGGDGARRPPRGAAAAPALLPLPLPARHHRRDHVAGDEPRKVRADPSRPRARRAGRAGRLSLQEVAQRRRADRSRGRARPGRSSASRSRSRRSCRSATTSASTTPPASASKRAASRARPTAATPSTTPSADNLDLIRPETLAGSVAALIAVVDHLESRECFRNLAPEGEPQLGRRGLYRLIGGDDAGRERELAILWMLNLSDGSHSLDDIAARSGLALAALREATAALVSAELLAPV